MSLRQVGRPDGIIPIVSKIYTSFSIPFSPNSVAKNARFNKNLFSFLSTSNKFFIISEFLFGKRNPSNYRSEAFFSFPGFGESFQVLDDGKPLLLRHVCKSWHACSKNTSRDGL